LHRVNEFLETQCVTCR